MAEPQWPEWPWPEWPWRPKWPSGRCARSWRDPGHAAAAAVGVAMVAAAATVAGATVVRMEVVTAVVRVTR